MFVPLSLPKPYPKPLAIFLNEDDASGLKGRLEGCNSTLFQGVSALKTGDGISGHASSSSKVTDAQAERRSSHLALDSLHFITLLRFRLTAV
ncbi:hypothetical protein AFCDBAGC_4886 [Methylobacterium cerastii]|uniref:Uncharacterized protein n=1 Tax=Methylobacterium cerastii TaxID=932741 RepID=A0ABQ4QQK6_9HYPH|nr:hypothetical protein AFCDBAGC_4886 [Methylobacterium cerastii]